MNTARKGYGVSLFVLVVALVALVVAGFGLVVRKFAAAPEREHSTWVAYENPALDFSFDYDPSWTVKGPSFGQSTGLDMMVGKFSIWADEYSGEYPGSPIHCDYANVSDFASTTNGKILASGNAISNFITTGRGDYGLDSIGYTSASKKYPHLCASYFSEDQFDQVRNIMKYELSSDINNLESERGITQYGDAFRILRERYETRNRIDAGTIKDLNDLERLVNSIRPK